MESIGDKLRQEREQKGYSIEQIARDTNIAKRYLEALEAEDFSVFPGDPYLIGFLRNYSDYLGIDPDEMVTLYNNFKIQSQPIPMAELLVKRDRKPLIIGIAVFFLVAILGVAGYFFVPRITDAIANRRAAREAAASEEQAAGLAGGTLYRLEDEMIERRFLEKDVIAVPHKDQIHEIELTEVGERLTLTVPGGTHVLQVGDERAIDLNGDANMDIKVALNDVDTGSKSAVLRFDMFVKSTPATVVAEETIEEVAETAPPELGSPGTESRLIEPSVILEADSREPFAVNINFRGYCLFRYMIDGDAPDEQYFNDGDNLVLDVTKEVRLWMSNAGNLSARIAGREVSFGRPGEVSVRLISWTVDEDTGQDSLLMQAIY
jgi:cytoskeletal protein RodZ